MADNQTPKHWAKEILSKPYAIIDTETTGLGDTDQIIQIACLLDDGKNFQNYVLPTVEISEGAYNVHGISKKEVSGAPLFDEIFLALWKFVGNRDILIYNADFDLRLIRQSLKACGIQVAFPTSDRRACRVFPNGGGIYNVMTPYSEYIGDWNEYYQSYTWQKLPGGDHSALGDCRATLKVLEEMAAS